MKILIVEDEITSRVLIQEILLPYGNCDAAANGAEAIEAFILAWKEKEPYDLICMDIMMPHVDGQQASKRIRELEKDMGIKIRDEVKIIMTTVLEDPKNVIEAYNKGGATSYIVKPIKKKKITNELRKFGLIN